MKPDVLFSALSSRTRLEILKILSSAPMTLMQVKGALNALGIGIRYRESVYRALEKLVSAGLVEKYYDSHERKMKYALAIERVELDVRSGRVVMKPVSSRAK